MSQAPEGEALVVSGDPAVPKPLGTLQWKGYTPRVPVAPYRLRACYKAMKRGQARRRGRK